MRHLSISLALCAALIISGLGSAGIARSAVPAAPLNQSAFALTSPDAVEGGELPREFTCDGASATLPLQWSEPPTGTQSLAMVMHHVAGPGDTHWYWVLYNIPASVRSLPKNVKGTGTLGTNSVNSATEYSPPCSKGPGLKIYTYTVYALSAPPQLAVPATSVDRDTLLAAIQDRTLASAALNVSYTRPDDAVTAPGSPPSGPGGSASGSGTLAGPGTPAPPGQGAPGQGAPGQSGASGTPGTPGAPGASGTTSRPAGSGVPTVVASAPGPATEATTAAPVCQARLALFQQIQPQPVAWCDETNLYVEANGVADHLMMVGITSWNHHVPLPQAFRGANAWRIPLHPALADSPSPTSGQDAIGVAINGVPIFDPTRQDGVYGLDSDPNLIGELDDCKGHSGRGEDYHYHAAPVCLVKTLPNAAGAVIGFGLDGFPILGFTEAGGSQPASLDRCNGHDLGAGEGYHYHATEGRPYLIGCFRGVVNLTLQPRTHPVRSPGLPVALLITGFERSGETSGHLEYVYASTPGATSYQKLDDGCWEFQYTNPPPGSPGDGLATQKACAQPDNQPQQGQPGQPGSGQGGAPGQGGAQGSPRPSGSSSGPPPGTPPSSTPRPGQPGQTQGTGSGQPPGPPPATPTPGPR